MGSSQHRTLILPCCLAPGSVFLHSPPNLPIQCLVPPQVPEPNSSLSINLGRTESLGADKATYPNSFLLVSIPAKHFTLAPAASRHQQAKV